MSQRVHFEVEAAAELEEAVAWYESRHSGLGAKLLAAVDPVVEDIGRWPDAGAPIRGLRSDLRVRKVLVAGFLSYLAYLIMDDEILQSAPVFAPLDEMVIDDLTEEEDQVFMETILNA